MRRFPCLLISLSFLLPTGALAQPAGPGPAPVLPTKKKAAPKPADTGIKRGGFTLDKFEQGLFDKRAKAIQRATEAGSEPPPEVQPTAEEQAEVAEREKLEQDGALLLGATPAARGTPEGPCAPCAAQAFRPGPSRSTPSSCAARKSTGGTSCSRSRRRWARRRSTR